MFTKLVKRLAEIRIKNGHCGSDTVVTGHCY